jgi:2-amino-4-hydroxy-6-hydroxymethyldihydropteridine diphosphokinase/dihydropteroate synthase
MIYISIGSNLGDRLDNIQKALILIKDRIIPNLKCSIILETEALLKDGSPFEWNKPFLNAICYGESNVGPQELLHKLKSIESELGRPLDYEKWSPRIIDLDIILFNNISINEVDLTIPHPELKNRPFLLHLLSMINPLLKDNKGETHFSDLLGVPNFSRAISPFPSLVGILNVTSDSFSDGGLYINPKNAISHAREMQSAGASIIDIGAQSTRPNATILAPEEEYSHLKPILEAIDQDTRISLDSFSNEVIKKALLRHDISWINDQSGSLDKETLEIIASKRVKLVIMRSLSLPAQKNKIPHTQDPVEEALKLLSKSVERAIEAGVMESNIILDPGIGFDHSIYQDMLVLRRISEIKKLGFPILIGHSRKSYIQSFSNSVAKERDLETVAISSFLGELGADFIRVHNVEYHQKFFTARAAISGGVNIL